MDSGPAPTLIYRLHPNVAYEGFDDGALILRLIDRHLFELNLTAQFVLAHTDAQHTVSDIATEMANEFGIDLNEAIEDVLALYAQFASQQIVEPCNLQMAYEQETLMPECRHIRNPDVGLREEDDGGALLFNADTSQVLVINATGLLIWKQCDGKHTLNEITDAVLEEFEGVSAEEVAADVREFIDDMTKSGFIGLVEVIER